MTNETEIIPTRQELFIGPHRIDPPLLAAPMAGFSDDVYRAIIRRLGGVGLPFTEMLSARGFFYKTEGRGEELDRLRGIRDEPKPLAAQIWDNDPGRLASMARHLAEEYKVSVIDLNFGCPARAIAGKAESGSRLLDTPERVEEIVARVAQAASPIPVTAKIRLGTSSKRITACEVAEAVERAGGAALTVHGRTAADKYRGQADWEQIARIKPHLKSIPLIGNGDLRSADDVVHAMATYPVDGVMIGRAALGRPWLFSQAAAALAGDQPRPEPDMATRCEIILDHHRAVCEHFGPERGTVQMRRFACNYVTGIRGSRSFRDQISRVTNPEEFQTLVRQLFAAED